MDPHKRYFPTQTPAYFPQTITTPSVYQNSPLYNSQTQQYRYSSSRSVKSGSKIGDMNDRLSQQTEMIRVKNQLKRNNYDGRSLRSNSRDSKRSQRSAQRNRIFKKYGQNSNYQPLRYQTDGQSMTSSRASNQMLRKPIITYGSDIRRQTPMFYQDSPSFNRQQPQPQSQSQYNTILSRPILQQEHQNPTFQKKPSDQFYKQPTNSQINNQNYNVMPSNQRFYDMSQKKDYVNQSFQQFLDMDFNKNQNKHKVGQSREFVEQQQPVSPVTYFHNNHIEKKTSEKTQPQILNTKYQNLNQETKQTQTFGQRVQKMLSKIDYDGKILTIFLVGLAIILVLLQLIK